ncbi:MAG: hypothetical protein QOE90_1122 [Thermoplasmata archaeon]|jgi:hypothetical protein|nr:hypothetical protein [Thermoplasmata archaeon]
MRGDLLFWRASALLLVALTALGVWLESIHRAVQLGGYWGFDRAGDILHGALALLAIAFATGLVPERVSRPAAGWTGVALLGLATLGFLSGRLFGLGPLVGLHLELAENVAHLALGAWAVRIGFAEGD